LREAMKKKHIGSSFEDFLKEEGIFEETTTQAVKRVLSWQISQTMRKKGITKIEMAKRMRTSRSQVDRFLDPNNARDSSESGVGCRQAGFIEP
jgi:antitoxin HicB